MADTVIFNNPSMAFVDTGMGLFLWQEMPSTITLTVGETYLVEWNGEQFNCVAVSANLNGVDGIGIGNLALAGVGGNTNEPFLLGVGADGSFSACYTTETKATNQMVITHVAEEDKDYLIKGSTLKAIGKAIREKTGKAEDIPPLDMPGEIRSITGGGSGVEVVYVTFMNHDGTKELHKRAVVPGNDCMEVVSGGELEMPTKESTAQYNYIFAGWSTAVNGGTDANALKNVTTDRVVYATYISTLRVFTVRFFDGDTQIGEPQSVVYGGSATQPTVTKDGYIFNGWSPSHENITGDTDCYAQWTVDIKFATATWAQIAEVSEAGNAKNYFAIGDKKQITLTNGKVCEVEIVGFDHDPLTSDASKTAGITVLCSRVPDLLVTGQTYVSSLTKNQAYGWADTPFTERTWCNETLYANLLPADVRTAIKQVNKKYIRITGASYSTSPSSASKSVETSSDYCWIASAKELGMMNITSAAWSDCFIFSKTYPDGDVYEQFADGENFTAIADYLAVHPTPKVGETDTKATNWLPRSHTFVGSSKLYRTQITDKGLGFTTAYNTDAYVRFGFCI